jgi:hypothetical protein
MPFRQSGNALALALAVAFLANVPATVQGAVTGPAAGVGLRDDGIIRVNGPVDSGKCDHCHGAPGIAKDPIVFFPHAYHLTYRCSICHSTFPHQVGQTLRIGMSSCMPCHGLRHGTSSSLAKDGFKMGCGLCHRQIPTKPTDHRAPGWSGKGHVAPARAGTAAGCMMCHTPAQCEACHRSKGVAPLVPASYVFAGASLCLACHGDPGISAMYLGRRKSYFISQAGLRSSVHSTATCTQCHSDFRYFVDVQTGRTARANASVACMNCHPKQSKVWLGSIHGRLYLAGVRATARFPEGPALCGSCHGGHDIAKVTTRAGAAALRAQSQLVCGTPACHQDKFDQYDDYYHGAAFKSGAPDAPSCWQCHGAHQILPASDPSSTVSAKMLPLTCGKCHPGTRAEFAKYAKMIHRSSHARQQSILSHLLATLSSWVSPSYQGPTLGR